MDAVEQEWTAVAGKGGKKQPKVLHEQTGHQTAQVTDEKAEQPKKQQTKAGSKKRHAAAVKRESAGGEDGKCAATSGSRHAEQDEDLRQQEDGGQEQEQQQQQQQHQPAQQQQQEDGGQEQEQQQQLQHLPAQQGKPKRLRSRSRSSKNLKASLQQGKPKRRRYAFALGSILGALLGMWILPLVTQVSQSLGLVIDIALTSCVIEGHCCCVPYRVRFACQTTKHA